MRSSGGSPNSLYSKTRPQSVTSSSEESQGSFKFVNVAETPVKKRKFSNSDDARSFEEAELKRGMKRREKMAKIIV